MKKLLRIVALVTAISGGAMTIALALVGTHRMNLQIDHAFQFVTRNAEAPPGEEMSLLHAYVDGLREDLGAQMRVARATRRAGLIEMLGFGLLLVDIILCLRSRYVRTRTRAGLRLLTPLEHRVLVTLILAVGVTAVGVMAARVTSGNVRMPATPLYPSSMQQVAPVLSETAEVARTAITQVRLVIAARAATMICFLVFWGTVLRDHQQIGLEDGTNNRNKGTGEQGPSGYAGSAVAP